MVNIQSIPRTFLQKSLYLVCLPILFGLIMANLQFGTVSLSWQTIFDIIQNPTHPYAFTLIEYRLPRTLLAVVIGGSLAVSGVLIQSIVRNPLASPDILGINSAAGLVAVACLLFFPALDFYWLPIFAFIGGVSAFLVLWWLCGRDFRPIKMAIVGVALASLWVALSHYLMLSYPMDINVAMLWLTGSLWGRSWNYVSVAVPLLCILLPLSVVFCRDLDTLSLGEQKAASLGVSLQATQITILLLAVALATTAVAVCGPISFLGLAAPHLARYLVGGRHSRLLPTAFLLGAMLLLLADILARVIDPPIELPAGILTAILGAPYFFYLLMRIK